ncbi:MAG: hypothetical protein UE116_05355 [Clostridia bacterium]|nr:hypothetical protein [Clostridia bacterium]
MDGVECSVAIKTTVEGYSSVGGLSGFIESYAGSINNAYANVEVRAANHSAGGIVGKVQNTNDSEERRTTIYNCGVYDSTIIANSNSGGLIGEIEQDPNPKTYYGNYIHANVNGERSTTSLGIGSSQKGNELIDNLYVYKYSKINNESPNIQNELFIPKENYLNLIDLKDVKTYINKLRWSDTIWDFSTLENNLYPKIKTSYIVDIQQDINLPQEENHTIYNNELIKNEEVKQTFKYGNKTIKTYETYSEIIAEDESSIVREGIRLYVKAGKLYALPVELSLGNSIIKLVENNFIIDSYNGKEYETVLGEDGKLYDLKEPLNYPENFVNKDINSIGNNLNNASVDSSENMDNEEVIGNNLHEIEVIYKNGDKVIFNYQTGKVIYSIEEKQDKIGLFDYMKEKISQIGNTNSGTLQRTTSKYEKSKVLQSKLEEMPVKEALQRKNSNANKAENVANDENNETKNSLKEKRYISIYNTEKDEYQIYQEEELLDTKKQEVISENEKIEANNLKEYYASEGEAKNTKMGIVWIALSIIGVVIILFAIKKRD